MNHLERLEAKGEWDSTRQRDFYDPTKHPDLNVTVVGLGGIGSPTAFALSKLGVSSLNLIDPDVVELHNVPNQMYTTKHIGVSKAQCMKAMCSVFGPPDVSVVAHVCTAKEAPETVWRGIVISGLDSMVAREETWDLVRYNADVTLYLDARIGGLDIVTYPINPTDVDHVSFYEKYGMFSDEEGLEAPCTARGRIDIGFSISSQLVSRVVEHLSGENPLEKVITYDHKKLRFNNGKWNSTVKVSSEQTLA